MSSASLQFLSCGFPSLTHWGRDKMDAISQTTSSSAFSWMKMYELRLKFHCSLFLRVQLTIFHYLNQWWLVYWRIYASLSLNELKYSLKFSWHQINGSVQDRSIASVLAKDVLQYCTQPSRWWFYEFVFHLSQYFGRWWRGPNEHHLWLLSC